MSELSSRFETWIHEGGPSALVMKEYLEPAAGPGELEPLGADQPGDLPGAHQLPGPVAAGHGVGVGAVGPVLDPLGHPVAQVRQHETIAFGIGDELIFQLHHLKRAA